MVVLGIFIIGGTFKSPELNAFPKLELLKTLLSFSGPWAATSISVKQQSAAANLTNSMTKIFVIKIKRSSVWWAFDAAVFPVYAPTQLGILQISLNSSAIRSHLPK